MKKKGKLQLAIVLGRLIRRRREDRGHTQQSLSNEIKINQNSLGQIERGITLPSVLTLFKLYVFLNISIDRLFRDAMKEEDLLEELNEEE
jgi:transcriptional regulator with XRE-family HTH domain